MTISTCDKNPCCGVPHDCKMKKDEAVQDDAGSFDAIASTMLEMQEEIEYWKREAKAKPPENRVTRDTKQALWSIAGLTLGLCVSLFAVRSAWLLAGALFA